MIPSHDRTPVMVHTGYEATMKGGNVENSINIYKTPERNTKVKASVMYECEKL